MTGIFDSGAGGLAAVNELRRLSPKADILFLADEKNAPYGTKSEDEILSLTEKNITLLLSSGADRVLIACCTASTVWQRLPAALRAVSVPIITATARKACCLADGTGISVIATEHTVRCCAFGQAIRRINANMHVRELSAQSLVGIAEGIALGKKLDKNWKDVLSDTVLRATSGGERTLVLGCTHFSHLTDEIKKINNNVKIIDAAKTGAFLVARKAKEGSGVTVFL